MNKKDLNKYREEIKNDMIENLIEITLNSVEDANSIFSDYISTKNDMLETLKDTINNVTDYKIPIKEFIINLKDLIHKFYGLDTIMAKRINKLINNHANNCKTICTSSASKEINILLENMYLFPSEKIFNTTLNIIPIKSANRYKEICSILRQEIVGNTRYILDFFKDSFGSCLATLNSYNFEVDENELKELIEIGGNSIEITPILSEYKNERPKKTFDYKALNKLATANGYVFDRQSGDHAQYIKNGKIITIPQGRPIGKGLSIKIQKSISFKEDNI